MNVKIKNRLKVGFVNTLGSIGYFVSLLAWVVVATAYFGNIKSITDGMGLDKKEEVIVIVTNAPVEHSVGWPLYVLAGLITVAMIVLSVYLIFKMPSTIAKTSKKVVREAAEHTAPLVIKAQHKPVTKRRLSIITNSLVLWLKVAIVLVPLALVYLSSDSPDKIIDTDVVRYISLVMAVIGAVFFALQYLVARLLTVDKKQIW